MGRDGKPQHEALTDELTATLCALVRVGIPLYLAAQEIGLPQSCLYDWLARGGYHGSCNHRKYIPPDEAREPYKSFARDVEAAVARSHNRMAVSVYQKAMKQRDGRLALSWLKARHPEIWSPTRADPVPVAESNDADTVRVSLHDYMTWLELQNDIASDR
jgi:hypothetical protein